MISIKHYSDRNHKPKDKRIGNCSINSSHVLRGKKWNKSDDETSPRTLDLLVGRMQNAGIRP